MDLVAPVVCRTPHDIRVRLGQLSHALLLLSMHCCCTECHALYLTGMRTSSPPPLPPTTPFGCTSYRHERPHAKPRTHSRIQVHPARQLPPSPQDHIHQASNPAGCKARGSATESYQLARNPCKGNRPNHGTIRTTQHPHPELLVEYHSSTLKTQQLQTSGQSAVKAATEKTLEANATCDSPLHVVESTMAQRITSPGDMTCHQPSPPQPRPQARTHA